MIPGLLEFESNWPKLQSFAKESKPPFVLFRKYWTLWRFLFAVYKDMSEAMNRHPDADVMINFASLRSAYDATLEAMQFPQVRLTST